MAPENHGDEKREHEQTDPTPEHENEGEGSRTADRRYREGVRKHLRTNDVEGEAREAAEALDDEDEAEAMRAAEEKGRAPAERTPTRK